MDFRFDIIVNAFPLLIEGADLILDFRFDIIVNAFPLLIEGAIFTIQITVLSVALGIVIGLFVGIGRISSIKVIRYLSAIYVDFLRGTPLLVQIFLIYFALPVVTGINMNPFVAAITNGLQY